MDPLSIAGTVAGLVTLVIEASQTIVTYYKSVKDGPKSVEELTQELALMHSVLKQLDSFLRSQPLKTASFDHLSVLGSALSTCDNSIRSISSKLQTPKHNGIARALATFTWPFTEKETQKRLEALRRCTATFQFSLTVEGW